MFGRHLLRDTRHSIVTPCRFYRTKSQEATGPKAEVKKKPDFTITPGSDQHYDLPSFLEYADRQNLSPTSPVYVGTHYEYIVASSLQSLGFSLTRTGRASDYGIDLLGHWSVPSLPAPIRVLLQCKAHNKALTPATARELEGAFSGAPAGWKGEGVMGFLAAKSQATKGMRDALVRSQMPMGFLQVTDEGKVLQFVWNHEATMRGLEGMGVTTRFMPKLAAGEVEQEIALTWNGWTISKERRKVEVVVVETNDSPAISSKVADETEPKKRGRPRKVAEPEILEKRSKKVEKPSVKAKAPKKALSKGGTIKPKTATKPKQKGQRKK
jgi:hypothetical protein